MQCMKCGQDVEEPNVFCEECLADMKNYPVRPGTVVQLPKYHEAPPRRPAPRRKQPPTPEEQIKSLRKGIRILAVTLAATVLLLAGAIFLLVMEYTGQEELLPGQNYSAATTATGDKEAR